MKTGKLLSHCRLVMLVAVIIVSGCAERVKLTNIRNMDAVSNEEIEANIATGLAYIKKGRLDYAELLFLKIIEVDSALPEVYNNLGIVYKMRGDLDKAISVYRVALQLTPNYYEAHNNLGIALRAAGNFDAAEKEYLAAVSIAPEMPDAYYNLGILYDLFLGKTSLAAENYKAYMQIAGKDKQVTKWLKDLKKRK